MTVESQIYERLTTFPGLSTLTADRIYPAVAPQGVVPPYAVYRRVDDVPMETFGDDELGNINTTRIQVDAYAKSFGQLTQIDRQMKKALHRWSNPVGSPPIEFVRRETYLQAWEETAILYRSTYDFIVDYIEDDI